MDVAVSGRLAYWNDAQQTDSWVGTLWSAPLDGSRAPIKEFATPGNLLSSELIGQDDGIYFAVYCRVDLSDNEVTGRTHVVRLRR
jgi:hypothetical protein